MSLFRAHVKVMKRFPARKQFAEARCCKTLIEVSASNFGEVNV